MTSENTVFELIQFTNDDGDFRFGSYSCGIFSGIENAVAAAEDVCKAEEILQQSDPRTSDDDLFIRETLLDQPFNRNARGKSCIRFYNSSGYLLDGPVPDIWYW